MLIALDEARKAAEMGEVPVGACLVVGGKVLARAHNLRENEPDPTAHAEILVLRRAAKVLGDWRLENATLYVTVEPCPMCAGAALLARVKRVVYGCADDKMGALGSIYDMSSDPRLTHRFAVRSGVLADQARELLRDFFTRERNRLK
ncbi:MAG TPA: nucleoside deaminase [Proteobacteria bacterium]|nr:nucleoside deaminase [Pseudomonadota bacterium]